MARIPGFHCHGPSSITGQGTEILQTSSVTRISKFFFFKLLYISFGYPGGSVVKNLPTNAGHARDLGLISGS